MKKIIITSLLLVIAAASSSFAADAASSASVLADAGKSVESGTAKIAKLSTGVHLAWKTAASGYAIITQHKSGVKAFGTSYDSTAITWAAAPKDTVHAVPGASDSSAVSGSGWSVM